jgi:hypothetical protein
MASVIREAVRLLRQYASALRENEQEGEANEAGHYAAALEKLVAEPDRATVERGARALADADGLHQCKLSLAVQGCPIGDAHHLQCDCRRMVRAVLHSLGSDAP